MIHPPKSKPAVSVHSLLCMSHILHIHVLIRNLFVAEFCACEDAGDDVSELAGRAESELQRGIPAQITQNHPHVRGA